MAVQRWEQGLSPGRSPPEPTVVTTAPHSSRPGRAPAPPYPLKAFTASWPQGISTFPPSKNGDDNTKLSAVKDENETTHVNELALSLDTDSVTVVLTHIRFQPFVSIHPRRPLSASFRFILSCFPGSASKSSFVQRPHINSKFPFLFTKY